MNTPSISAVIPAYNAASYLGSAVASVHRQSVGVNEIIVVDDGSSDNTAAVAESLGPPVRCLRQDNAGPAAARNRGIRAADGEWIAFLDADDQWTADKTRAQLEAAEAHPELALIASDMAEVDAGGAVTVPSVLERHGMRERFVALAGRPLPRALAALLSKNFIPTGTVLVRRAVLDEVGAFDPRIRYGEDLELWARIAARYPITCLAQVHMLRRRHGANATGATEAMLRDLTQVMAAARRWGENALRAEGVDPDRLVARAWADLGYWYFDARSPAQARAAFGRSLAEKLTPRALAYYASCAALPPAALYGLRRLKQFLAGTGGPAQ